MIFEALKVWFSTWKVILGKYDISSGTEWKVHP